MKKRLNIFLLAFPLCPVFQIQAQEKPNLVFIMADQWRGDALGCLGKEPVKTPCLDQLAREGVNFTNAVSSYPVSSPARGMLMTGMYPHKNKVTGNCNSANAPYGVELPQEVYNTKCANSQIAIIFFQTFVNENYNEACCQIHQERRHTDSDGVFYDCTAQFVNASAEMKQLVLVGEGLELPHQ